MRQTKDNNVVWASCIKFLLGYPSLRSVAYLSLYSDNEELHGEAQEVSGVKAMPYRQKEQRGHMGQSFIAQELQPLEHMPKNTKLKENKSNREFCITLYHKSG